MALALHRSCCLDTQTQGHPLICTRTHDFLSTTSHHQGHTLHINMIALRMPSTQRVTGIHWQLWGNGYLRDFWLPTKSLTEDKGHNRASALERSSELLSSVLYPSNVHQGPGAVENLLRAGVVYQKGAGLSVIVGRCHSGWSLYCYQLVGHTATTTIATSSNKITIIIPAKEKQNTPLLMSCTRKKKKKHHSL